PAGVYRCEECRPSYVRGQVFHLKAVQGQASAFVTEHIANEPLGLPPDLTNEQLTKVMDAITRSMLVAWADGYMKALPFAGRE
ncbi:MAG: hypothetical protein DMD89_30235, partial [Candidatus Rokuibacteriota bacterium]